MLAAAVTPRTPTTLQSALRKHFDCTVVFLGVFWVVETIVLEALAEVLYTNSSPPFPAS